MCIPQELVDDLKGDLSGNFLSTMKCLCMGPAEFDAHQLNKAMKGLGTDEDVLIEIVCTRSNAQLTEVKRVYKESEHPPYSILCNPKVQGSNSSRVKEILPHT